MFWFGLTGGIGTGKSTVSNFIKKRGIPVVDADAISYQITEPGGAALALIKTHFGPGFFSAIGELDRKKLGQIVFADSHQLKMLEAIIHPLVQQEVKKTRAELEKQKHIFAFYDVPLIFESQIESQFDQVFLVACKPEQQIERVKLRNKNLSEDEIRKRIQAQISIEKKKSLVDYVIQNSGSLSELEVEVDKLIKYLDKYKTTAHK